MTNMFASTWSALKSAGSSPATILTVFKSMGSLNSPSTTANGLLTQIAAVADQPTEVARLVNLIKEIPGVAASVATAAGTLVAPAGAPALDTATVVERIPAVEAAITTASPSFFSRL